MANSDTDFDVLTAITDVEIIARGTGVRVARHLNRAYGHGRWRKLKGRAWIRLRFSGEVLYAELHWFEAHGIGRRRMKVKRVFARE